MRISDRDGARPAWTANLGLATNKVWVAHSRAEPCAITDEQKSAPRKVHNWIKSNWMHIPDKPGQDILGNVHHVTVADYNFETGGHGRREVLGGDCETGCMVAAEKMHEEGISYGAMHFVFCIAKGVPHCVLAIDTDDGVLIFDNLVSSVVVWGSPVLKGYVWLSASVRGTFKEIET